MRTVAATPKTMPAAIGAGDAADLKKLTKQAGEAAQLLKLLGNEKRLLILCFLAARGEMTVRADGLVAFRRTSQTLHYRVADKRALQVLQVLKQIYCGDLK